VIGRCGGYGHVGHIDGAVKIVYSAHSLESRAEYISKVAQTSSSIRVVRRCGGYGRIGNIDSAVKILHGTCSLVVMLVSLLEVVAGLW
jgi:hypothetical protein